MPVAFSLTLLQTMSYRRLLPLALSFVLAGCSTIQNIFDPLSPGADSSAAFVLTAKGVQQFQCTADANGRYWKFITPQAELTDGKGRVVARQGSEGSFLPKTAPFWPPRLKSTPTRQHRAICETSFTALPRAARKACSQGSLTSSAPTAKAAYRSRAVRRLNWGSRSKCPSRRLTPSIATADKILKNQRLPLSPPHNWTN